MKAKIKNYQIIKEAELEFLPGITAIVGNSNNGKSSIIRAIEAAINNKGGIGFINHNADQCDVIIEDNGHSITWTKHKKQGKSAYTIDNVVLKKIGQKQLDEVGTILNMPEVEINAERFRLNFWKQLDFPFLVGKTSYQLFDFISRSTEQELISELQSDSVESAKQLSKDSDYTSAQIDTKQLDINGLTTELKSLEKFIKFDLAKYDALAEIYNILDASITELAKVNAYIEANTSSLEIVNNKLTKLSIAIKEIDQYLAMYNSLQLTIETLNATSLSIDNAKETLDKHVLNEQILSKKVSTAKNIISELDVVSTTYKIYKDIFDSLDAVDLHKKQLDEAIVSKNKAIVSINTQLAEFTVCPLCGSNLGGHIHE